MSNPALPSRRSLAAVLMAKDLWALPIREQGARRKDGETVMFPLHLRNELWKLFGKKRTYIGFGAFVITQNVVLLFFRASHARHEMERTLAGNGYLASEYMSALTVAFIMLIPQVALLLPLYAALVGGDLVAKEVEDGTLRMILCRPVSRFQLLFAKWLAGIAFAAVLVIVLGATAVCFARIWFPWRGMFMASGWPEPMFNVMRSEERRVGKEGRS